MARSNRRALVNLTVFAGSATMFAAAWAGVVRADREALVAEVSPSTPSMVAAAPAVTPALATSASTPAMTTTAEVQTQPVPTPAPRQVVVVRQSRAS